jgi:hypothetical protein
MTTLLIKSETYKRYLLPGVLLGLYMLLRIIAWSRTVLLEDTDSLLYLHDIKEFLSMDVIRIWGLSTVSSITYPLFGAIFSIPGWGIEFGARTTSFVASLLIFGMVYLIANRYTKGTGILSGLFLIAVSPILISMSFAVLTEPLYVAGVYLGLYVFLRQYTLPSNQHAALLGFLFGLSFLNRVEGLLFLVAIPVLQGGYYLFSNTLRTNLRPFISWTLVYIGVFSLLAVPHVWRMSDQLNMFAINGRQVWSLIMQAPDGKSEYEKFFGLDFSPSEINIAYLYSNTDKLRELSPSIDQNIFVQYGKNFVLNFITFNRQRLGDLFGAMILIFFGIGLYAVFRHNNRYEGFVLIAFIAVAAVAPLLHDSKLNPRSFLTIVPLVLLIAGMGVDNFSRELSGGNSAGTGRLHKTFIVFLLGMILVSWIIPLKSALYPGKYNGEYGITELEEPKSIVKTIAEKELHRMPVIVDQRGFLASYSGAVHMYMPYTDYTGLVRFCELNEVDLLHLKYRRLMDYPFIGRFADGDVSEHFQLLYRGIDGSGSTIELYRFLRTED